MTTDSPSAAPHLLIRAGAMLDGTGGAAVRDAAVLIGGDRIVAAGRAEDVCPGAGAQVTTIDLPHGTLLPGLVDAHFHAGYCGHRGMAELESPRPVEFQALCAGLNVQQALRCGYTSALDVGSRGRIGVAVRSAVDEGLVPGPRLRVSGQMIDAIGGAVDLWPGWIRTCASAALGTLVSGVDEVVREVRRQVRDGVDNIKLIGSGSAANVRRGGTPISLRYDELAAAVDLAHELGVTVACHAEGSAAIANAARAGVDTIHHATALDERALAELDDAAGSPPRLVFTLGVYAGIIRQGRALGYPEAARRRVEELWERTVAGVRLAIDAGVPFAVGSDCGGVIHPHGRYAVEAELLVDECGLDVPAAIAACTRSAALAAGFDDTGVLAPGARADVIVIDSDITTTLSVLRDEERVAVVVRGGETVKLDGALAAAARHQEHHDREQGAPA